MDDVGIEGRVLASFAWDRWVTAQEIAEIVMLDVDYVEDALFHLSRRFMVRTDGDGCWKKRPVR